MTSRLEPRVSVRKALILLLVIVIVTLTGIWTSYGQEVKALLVGRRPQPVHQLHIAMDDEGHYLALPEILVETGIYPNFSFANNLGIMPAYWEGNKGNSNHTTTTTRTRTRPTIGPCYDYRKHRINWEEEIARYNSTRRPCYNHELITKKNAMDLEGYCRPGFLIIGAGKCGTSSLYHYISMHPKVLPASQKQIHYFKYHQFEPLKWYYQHFPSTTSFLSAGALITGEASPGYLPYPDVVIDIKQRMPEPRLLAIGRNPLERAYSSYKYNYIDPHLKYLSKGKQKGIPKHQPDEFYMQFLFSFEEMIKAELAVLQECLASGSEAEKQTRQKWGRVSWIRNEYKLREKQGLPHLLDLDGFCYGGKVNATILRKQWINLMAEQPNKILFSHNTHLTQALIGRSLYLFPLEWWYAAFSKDHIYFVCTEELEDFSGESINGVGQFLGLPRFENFSTVVQTGAYNVGGHKGYDHEISWSQLNKEHKNDSLPLSKEFRRVLEDFIRPYNERLFSLTGRRCDW